MSAVSGLDGTENLLDLLVEAVDAMHEAAAGGFVNVRPLQEEVLAAWLAARDKALAEKVAQEIRDAFPLDEIEAICTLGHDCHNAARYTTGRMAARIARDQIGGV